MSILFISLRYHRFFLYMMVITFICVISISCKKYLKADLPSSLIERNLIFSDDITATSAVTGIYVEMLGSQNYANGSNTSIASLAGLSSDELKNYPRYDLATIQFEENNLIANNFYILNLWGSMYKSIFQANAIVEGLGESTNVSSAVKEQLLGEAYFIRAFAHFYLVNLFGDVPLITSTDYQVNSLINRTPADEVYSQIIKDLQQAQLKLSESYVTAEKLRPNKSTATALLSRVYLYREEWAKAEGEASKIIDHANYSLVNNLNHVFKANSAEAIWQLRPAVNGSTGNPNEAFYFNPPIVTYYNVLRNDFVDDFEVGDKRLINWTGNIVVGTETIYHPYKYQQSTAIGTTLTEYSMVFRLAEQYLIRAEARTRLNDLAGAQDDLNIIRVRAGLGSTLAMTQAELIDAVEQERRIELFTEWGHRWLDLKRWNKILNVLAPIKPGFTQNDALYPIPQSELDKNVNLKPQNSGY